MLRHSFLVYSGCLDFNEVGGKHGDLPDSSSLEHSYYSYVLTLTSHVMIVRLQGSSPLLASLLSSFSRCCTWANTGYSYKSILK